MRLSVGSISDRLRRRPAGDVAGTPGRNFRAAPRHAVTTVREGSRLQAAPTAEQPAPASAGPRPSFTPAQGQPRHAPPTEPNPIPVTARPYMSTDALDPASAVRRWVQPAIGDAMAASAAEPAPYEQLVLQEPAEPRATALLYTAPGWAGLQMSRWVARGEWEALYPIVERGYERNAAAMAVGLLRNRATIRDGVLQGCAAIERLDLARELLRRAHELTVNARARVAEAGAA
jgi:hypothetical protein